MAQGARNRFRRLGLGLLAGAGAMAVASLTTPGLAAADTADTTAPLPFPPPSYLGGPPGDPYACMAADVFGCAIVFGGSGIPIPPQDYIDAVNERYIQPEHPGFTPQALFTPEGLQPFTGVKQLTLNESMAQGLILVDAALKQQLAAGHQVDLYGYSQSATIDTLEERNLLALPADQRPSPEQLSFTLLGDPNNPNGGMLQIFDLPALQDAAGNGPTIPSLGVTFDGATPDSIYPTTITTLEYDGFADFPRYPIDLLADLNAVAGIQYVHDQYPELTQAQLDSAITLPT
ncbi:MAG: PE-PPE domain-containing protein, partial [Mycobacterium sp.]